MKIEIVELKRQIPDCPLCGCKLIDNSEFCHPIDRDKTLWRAGCIEHYICGFEVRGNSKLNVIDKWIETCEMLK